VGGCYAVHLLEDRILFGAIQCGGDLVVRVALKAAVALSTWTCSYPRRPPLIPRIDAPSGTSRFTHPALECSTIALKNFRIFSKLSTCHGFFGWNRRWDPNHCLDMVPASSTTDDPPHHRITETNPLTNRLAKEANRPTR
jgi:hypothetical protein